MNLVDYYRHKVKILADNGRSFVGFVSDYIWPDENENGKESIIIDTDNIANGIEFYADDIVSIEILD